jgi:hypothetical protein
MLLESLSAERTGYSGDTLRANASGIHNPENAELLGANGTIGDELISHEALSSRTSVDARSPTAAAPEEVTCQMPKISALPDEIRRGRWEGQPWLKGFLSPPAATSDA